MLTGSADSGGKIYNIRPQAHKPHLGIGDTNCAAIRKSVTPKVGLVRGQSSKIRKIGPKSASSFRKFAAIVSLATQDYWQQTTMATVHIRLATPNSVVGLAPRTLNSNSIGEAQRCSSLTHCFFWQLPLQLF